MIPKLKHPSKTELPELSWTAVISTHCCVGSIGIVTLPLQTPTDGVSLEREVARSV
jgi:hypothetical protein